MADYKISLEAQNDLQQAYIYGVERYGVPAADDFYDALSACFDVIASSPRTWPRVEHVKQGYRRYIYRKGRGRTSIYYRIVGDIVEIMAVVQRQNLALSL